MSIKKQLTSLIISTVILASFFAALHGYRNSLSQLDSVFDQELLTAARLIATVATEVDSLPASIDSNLVFQVIENGVVRSASSNAPNGVIKAQSNAFGSTTFFGKRWRTYAIEISYRSSNIQVVVAHPIAARIVLEAGARRGVRVADQGCHPRCGEQSRFLSAPVLGWHAPTSDGRHGSGM